MVASRLSARRGPTGGLLRPTLSERAEAREQINQAKFGPPLVLRPDEILPNPKNPRRHFDEIALNQLAQSMKELGQLQPIVVRRVGQGWMLIAGERRWRAAQRGGIETLWAIEKQADDLKAYAMSWAENAHREGLTHAEQVAALDDLCELAAVQGIRGLATKFRMDHTWISRQVRMRKDPVIFPALEVGKISFGQAAELLRAPAAHRRELLARALQGGVGAPVIRTWVDAIKREVRLSAAAVNASIAVGAAEEITSGSYHALLAQLRALGVPTTPSEIRALETIALYAQDALARARPRELTVVG